jgi:hypothetical protein
MELQTASSLLIDGYRATESDTPKALPKIARPDAVTAVSQRNLPEGPTAEEVISPDERADLTPAQSVERKLTVMLRGGAAIPVSHFRLARLCGRK